MSSQKTKGEIRKKIDAKKASAGSGTIAYRMKCAKTANGLSHFVMYGDVKKDDTLL